MFYTYEANLWRGDDGWYASVPAFPSIAADGDTVAEACECAASLLQLMIAERIDCGDALPAADFGSAPRLVLCVEVSDGLVEETRCMTLAEAAAELGVSRGRVSQLISSGALQVVERGGKRLVTIASVNARKANPPAPHRPKAR